MIKRLVVALTSGAVVLGAVTAFAASMTVNTTSLGAGNQTVSACNSAASVSYTPAWSAGLGTYVVGQVTVTSAAGCAGMSYRVTVTGPGTSTASLAESTGVLGTDGSNDPATGGSTATGGSFATTPAASVSGVQVVITG